MECGGHTFVYWTKRRGEAVVVGGQRVRFAERGRLAEERGGKRVPVIWEWGVRRSTECESQSIDID